MIHSVEGKSQWEVCRALCLTSEISIHAFWLKTCHRLIFGWALNFAVEVGEDACVGRLCTFACFCGRQTGGAVAAKAEHLKSAKYAALKVSHHFVSFAVETSGVLSQAALSLVWDNEQHLCQATGEEHSK